MTQKTNMRISGLGGAKIIILVLLIGLLSTNCKKKNEEIPYVDVNFDISLTDPAAVDLNAVGGWVYVTGGVRGIIIYRKSQTEYIALERNCPYQPDKACVVQVDASNVKIVDDCCGSVFSIIDGIVLNGPSTRSLKQYKTTINGNLLLIQN